MNQMNIDAWVPVGLAADFPANTAHPVLIHNREVVIWRASGEDFHAWEDRCPHRGMRLSFGFVRDDRLVCLYHGWEYAEGGNCQKIPAHPDLDPPKTICSTAYGVHRDGGIVFVNLAGGETLPDADAGVWHPVRSIYAEVPPDRVRAQLHGGKTALGPSTGPNTGGAIMLRHGEHGHLRIALQDCGAGCTGIHVTSETDKSETISALAALAVRARREFETA